MKYVGKFHQIRIVQVAMLIAMPLKLELVFVFPRTTNFDVNSRQPPVAAARRVGIVRDFCGRLCITNVIGGT